MDVEPAGARTGSHIERSDQTICGMTGGIMRDTNVAVVGLVLMADSGAGCASRRAIFLWHSLLGYLAAVNVHRWLRRL